MLHPTAERLLQWRRLLSAKGWKPLNETWGYAHHDDTSDLGRVCNWAPGAGLATCEVGTCPGHNADDVLPSPPKYCSGTRGVPRPSSSPSSSAFCAAALLKSAVVNLR